ncbi:response regulator transcription factor [Allosphingosinicella deserti]|uniref:Response regulatory domain-containing protein n=1 Tax=Allosphingosinicella deserti TaxID=2116704 RepID=A0A2P7QRW6_9SPHN|nr:response regulator [Sphingomonas deserti]PSJ40702.1 hypothetical protein C7I55_10345 [Sphingomonas deserti]
MASTPTNTSRSRPIVSVIDDDAAMRAALTDLLDSLGCQSQAFGSSELFLSAEEALSSDLVITDIEMGPLDGLGLLKRLGEILAQPVPVIVITALSDERLERRAAAEGCFAFLRKPFDPDRLIAHVRNAVALS